MGDQGVHLLDVGGHAVAYSGLGLFSAETKAGQGRAQVVGDGGDGLGPLGHVTADSVLHVIEGGHGGAHLARAGRGQGLGLGICAQALGGFREQADGPGQTPGHDPDQRRQQGQGDQKPHQDARLPRAEQAARRRHHGPSPVLKLKRRREGREGQMLGQQGEPGPTPLDADRRPRFSLTNDPNLGMDFALGHGGRRSGDRRSVLLVALDENEAFAALPARATRGGAPQGRCETIAARRLQPHTNGLRLHFKTFGEGRGQRDFEGRGLGRSGRFRSDATAQAAAVRGFTLASPKGLGGGGHAEAGRARLGRQDDQSEGHGLGRDHRHRRQSRHLDKHRRRGPSGEPAPHRCVTGVSNR